MASRRPRPRGVTPQEWADRTSERFREAWKSSASATTTSSAPPSPGTTRPCRSSSSRSTTTATSSSAPTRASTASPARPITPRTSWSTATARSTVDRVERVHGGELLLQALPLRGPAARALRGHPGGRAARDPPQRGARASSSQGLPTSRSAGPRSPGACPLPWDPNHVAYVWFDALDQLLHRGGLRHRPRAVRALLAGRLPPHRQGHPPLPRRLLAGDAHGRRRGAAEVVSSRTAGCWSAARR